MPLHTVLFTRIAPLLLLIVTVCAYQTYHRVNNAILAGFDGKLSAAAATSAVFIDGSDHEQLMELGQNSKADAATRAEDTPLYANYSKPMQRIMNEGGLTYHYTLVVLDERTIAYGIDATVGEEHSDLGTVEENEPDEANRLIQAVQTSSVSISPIRQFELWGKLKIANAPITTASGRTTALVGADVNISVIDKKTHSALIQVLFAGGMCLTFASWFTWRLSLRLARPLQELKDFALRCGAGEDQLDPTAVSHPELQAIAKKLAVVGAKLQLDSAAPSPRTLMQTLEYFEEELSGEHSTESTTLTQQLLSDQTMMRKLQILRSVAALSQIPDEELSIIAASAIEQTYSPNALLVPKNSIPSYVFIPIAGGFIENIDTAEDDGLVGLDAIVLHKPLGHELRADPHHGVNCLLLQKEQIMAILNHFPSILSRRAASLFAETAL